MWRIELNLVSALIKKIHGKQPNISWAANTLAPYVITKLDMDIVGLTDASLPEKGFQISLPPQCWEMIDDVNIWTSSLKHIHQDKT